MAFSLMDYRSQMTALHEKVKKHTKAYIAQNAEIANGVQEIQEIYDTRLNRTKPEVMVYGIYNAGKSSIINELLGEDKATVQDIPTTDSVDYYEWNGYRIADTPGVGAPIAHENITQEHLKKADVVIFVMSTTGSNELRQNYERMKDIVDAGKKIIIVLNDKNGDLGKNDAGLAQIRLKVVENMQSLGIQDAEKKYMMVIVNAKRARLGRIKGKEALRKMSNIEELMNIIMQELKKTGSFAILSSAVGNVEEVLNKILAAMEQIDVAGKDWNAIYKNLADRRRDVREEMETYIDLHKERLSYAFYEAIWKNRDNREEAEKQVHKLETEFANSTLQKLQTEFKEWTIDFGRELKEIQQTLVQISEDKHTQVPSVAVAELSSAIGEAESTMDTFLAGIEEMAKGAIKGQILKDVATSTIGSVIEKAGLTGILGKVVAPVIPVVGPALTVLSFMPNIINILKRRKEAERKAKERENELRRLRAEAEKQAKEELKQKCGYSAGQYIDLLKNDVHNSILTFAETLAEPLKEAEQKSTDLNLQLQADLEAIRKTVDEFHVLRESLKSNTVM